MILKLQNMNQRHVPRCHGWGELGGGVMEGRGQGRQRRGF